jgi:hypothetical protein
MEKERLAPTKLLKITLQKINQAAGDKFLAIMMIKASCLTTPIIFKTMKSSSNDFSKTSMCRKD